MHDPSDGIAEELERQLQFALATAAVAARRAIAAREQALEQAKHESEQATRATQARIDAERLLAAERLRPVFDPAWWETAAPREIAEMWQDANSWRDPNQTAGASPTIFDHAAHRIREEVRDHSGLNTTQVITLAAVQELEHDHQDQLTQAASQRPSPARQDPRRFDDPQRRAQHRARLAAAGVPEAAIEARSLADLSQAREAAEAARTPAAAGAEPRPAAAQRARRELQRRR